MVIKVAPEKKKRKYHDLFSLIRYYPIVIERINDIDKASNVKSIHRVRNYRSQIEFGRAKRKIILRLVIYQLSNK